jgi:uncharacterized protein (TIGR02246 family)
LNCGFWFPEPARRNIKHKFKEKKMNTAQIYGTASIAVHTIDSTPQKPKSALRGVMHRLCAAFVACTLFIAATGTARAAQAQNEAAVRALGDGFAQAFIQKNADARASLFAENGTFITPQGDFLQGRDVMVKDFGSEAGAVNGSTQATFSNYRIRFVKPDVAVADALLTLHNVNGPDGTVIPVIPVNFFFVAARHGDHWLIEDGRAHFAPAPPNGMTAHQ